jgi:hypothetical protein
MKALLFLIIHEMKHLYPIVMHAHMKKINSYSHELFLSFIIIIKLNIISIRSFTVGVFYAISTLLNQIVLKYYPGAEEDAGRMGLCIVVAGMLGSVVCGIILDKTHRFK